MYNAVGEADKVKVTLSYKIHRRTTYTLNTIYQYTTCSQLYQS